MPRVEYKPAPGAQLVGVSGGGVLRTDSPDIFVVDKSKRSAIQVTDFIEVKHRSFYVSYEGYIAIPEGYDVEYIQMDSVTEFNFYNVPTL